MRILAWLLLSLCVVPAAHAERVVALSPHLAELACAAGGCQQLVGRVAYSDYPEAVIALPLVGDAFAVNLEALLALKPTLVLIWEGGTPAATVDQLRRIGVRTELVKVESLDDISVALRTLGVWLGTDSQAIEAAEQFERGMAALREKYQQRAPLRVLYQIEMQPMFSISHRSPISKAIEICGGINVFDDLPGIAAPINAEAALVRDPQVIVFSQQDQVRGITEWWADFPAVSAVAGAHLYTLDANLLARATPRMLDGVESLCQAIDRARSPAD